MTYEETLHYLYTSTPVYQHSGASAYKPGLDTSMALDSLLHHPHTAYRCIHIGGTNGKGSVSNILAAILQQAGYKVGLYTSPHLVDFRERIRVNGEMISERYVVDFVAKYKKDFEPLHPSFFELTSTMAFAYFRDQKVDFALIEVGLGGRLDSTNIITPILSIITNVSKDHTQFLGDTLGEIAYEKAGIIKQGVPVVIGEPGDEITEKVFRKKAEEMQASLHIPSEEHVLKSDAHLSEYGEWFFDTTDWGMLFGELGGLAQFKNAQTILCSLRVLTGLGVTIPQEAVKNGFENVTQITGLQGRWQEVLTHPYTIIDTGHNVGAWQYITYQLEAEAKERPHLYMIIGLSNDKNIEEIVKMMPKEAYYFFTQASIDRALPAEQLAQYAEMAGLKGEVFPSVVDAVFAVMATANDEDIVFIGGSNFIVAEALPLFEETDYSLN
ncbi:folylpolyglutamate synthase/dihydrofolate synthase family protein [Parabacteroides sp. PFB2-10]|uniref:bifunctional folylpolyglutamate synthase/dihydrofolate synthase n=1 Tax=Parabacteroides sp. PFB2-10 TaxID=1742405 RepID=UPI002473AE01|nr:folylpolyglutamate synthase/dihydrofolate synthase family protein [Parabacteroides sp. PFB2-10]